MNLRRLCTAFLVLVLSFAGASPHHGPKPVHDGTNVLYPIAPSVDFDLFPANFSYSAYGYIDSIAKPDTLRLPAELHWDHELNSVVLSHTTVYHRIVNDHEGTISFVVPESYCLSVMNGYPMNGWCTWKTSLNASDWIASYKAEMFTDGLEHQVSVDGGGHHGGHGGKLRHNKKAVKHQAWVFDHHTSPYFPVPGRQVAVTVYQFVKGNLDGMIKSWMFAGTLGASVLNFEITFESFKKGLVNPSKFALPSWWIDVPRSQLNEYVL